MYTCDPKTPTFFVWLYSFYKCWPIFIIFGTQYTELMWNINHYLFSHLTYCAVATLPWETLDKLIAGKVWHRAKSHNVDAQKLMPYLCKDARASFSSIPALRLMVVIIAISYWCSRCCIHSFRCWWRLRIPVRQCTSASRASDGQTPSVWNCEIHCSRLMAFQIVLIWTP